MAKAGLVAASTFSPVTLIFFGGGRLKEERAQHPVRQIGSAFGGYEFQYSGPKSPKFSNQCR
jgi:hypothetical protein